jgi:hypothetical protein
MRKGQGLWVCPDCLVIGTSFVCYSADRETSHKAMHAAGLLRFSCRRCGSEVVNRDAQARALHHAACQHAEGREPASKRGRKQVCPKCGSDLQGLSEHGRIEHIAQCSVPAEGGRRDQRHDAAAAAAGDGPFFFDELPTVPWHQNPHVQAPTWAAERIWSARPVVCDPHENFPCDGMLLNALRAEGHHDVSNSTLKTIYKVLNSPLFQRCLAQGKISSSLEVALKREEAFFGSNFREVRHENSLLYVRDLKDVIVEIFSDPAIVSSLVFDGSDVDTVTRSDGMRFARRWTEMENGRKRRLEAERLGAFLQPLGLWADEGEVDDAGNPIWLIVLVPLNVAPTIARRSDCCFPIAYTYSASDITDCLRYLLLQFQSLRSVARMLPGVQKPVFVSVEGICGDYPAVAKLTMRCQVSGARFPCSKCMIEGNKPEKKYINDPMRWLNEGHPHRTQVYCSLRCFITSSNVSGRDGGSRGANAARSLLQAD